MHSATTGRRFLSDETGSGLIEFTLSAVVLLVAIFGIMDFSRALYADHYVSNAARDATRYAMVRGSSWKGASCVSTATFGCTATTTDIANFVSSDTPMGFTASALTVTTSWPGTTATGVTCDNTNGNDSPNCIVKVKVSYAFNFVLPFLPRNALILSSESSVAVAQ